MGGVQGGVQVDTAAAAFSFSFQATCTRFRSDVPFLHTSAVVSSELCIIRICLYFWSEITTNTVNSETQNVCGAPNVMLLSAHESVTASTESQFRFMSHG